MIPKDSHKSQEINIFYEALLLQKKIYANDFITLFFLLIIHHWKNPVFPNM